MAEFSYRVAKGQPGKAAAAATMAAGYLTGMPVVQGRLIVETMWDMFQGKTDDWLRFIWGSYTREKAERERAEKTRPLSPTEERLREFGESSRQEKRPTKKESPLEKRLKEFGGE